MSELAPPVSGALIGVSPGEHAVGPAPPARIRTRRTHVGYRRALRIFLALAVTAVVAVVAYRMLTRRTAVRIGWVQPGTVREEIVGPGTVQSRYAVSIGSRVAGTIDRVLVDVGQEVVQGQLLATLDPTELDARLGATRGAVASGEQEVALAKANLAKARSDLELARIRDERTQGLLAAGVVPAADADDTRGALRAAEANSLAARAAVVARDAELGRLRQEQRAAETILSYTVLASPMAGTITRRALEPGSAVAPGAVVFQLVDADALWVATLVDQSLAGRIELGQPAIIHLRSGPEVSGHVARIAFEADPVTRELEIDVAFDERPARFAIHEEADVTILGEEAHGLTIPLAAVSHRPEGTGVYVVEDGRAHRRSVQLGVVGAKTAQVVEGLSEDDAVILTPSAVGDGQRVTATSGGK